MGPAVFAVLGAAGGASITATCSMIIFLVEQRKKRQNDHMKRALEGHLDRYERVFVSARTAQDALRNYRAISGKVTDRSDPFLFQLLIIAEISCHDYCVAVTWSHNPGMLYLSIELENECLKARNLIHKWLAVRRLHAGDVAFVKRADEVEAIPLAAVAKLGAGDYRELRIETRRLVLEEDGEAKHFAQIDRSLSKVIVELKKVMSY
ncbi:hypothetical protein [Paractinoplanes durhamensis]|uniref:hypothetical protein n=1 Tax=Paractinoplanes durhamensis TaxID=113563 RepID=UPI001942E06F|nr:hypothetical protein [Actinoplanes durhamensis]